VRQDTVDHQVLLADADGGQFLVGAGGLIEAAALGRVTRTRRVRWGSASASTASA
jgi:hypothetical protein